MVLRRVRKSYALQGRSEEVVALRCIDLVPEEGDEAEESANGNEEEETLQADIGHTPMPAIRRGEFVMIRGPSGGGKTTLLNILGTIDSPTAGSVHLFGQRIDRSSSDKYLAHLRLCKIGFVFQTFNLIATMSAYENVELPMLIKGTLTKEQCRARALELLDLVGLQDRYGHLPSELSGGEQQRVTIARALANEPELLLLDEPTGDLDSRNTVDIMDLLLSINQGRIPLPSLDPSRPSRSHTPTTLIMVTHNPDLECYADRILYVEDGAFKKQAINRRQRRIDYAKYIQHINQQGTQQ